MVATVGMVFAGGIDLYGASANKFFLDQHEEFLGYNGFVVIFDIVLWSSTVIFNSFLCKEVNP